MNLLTCLKDVGAGKFHVVLIGPETTKDPEFLKHAVLQAPFREQIIQVVMDEAHAISEWGGDDFRPDYSFLGQLCGHLPSCVPWLLPTATCSVDTFEDIITKLSLPADTKQIEFSNAKPNVTLSVQQLQCPTNSYSDLISLISADTKEAANIPQTIIYCNARIVTEDMQDVLWDHIVQNHPDIDPKCVEFYH